LTQPCPFDVDDADGVEERRAAKRHGAAFRDDVGCRRNTGRQIARDSEFGHRMLPRNRTAPPEKRIKQAGLDVRDAEDERVVGGSHASIDIVATHVVVARFARATVEQRAETLFEPELLRKNMRALCRRAVRCVLTRGVEQTRGHPAGAERRNAQHDTLAPRRGRGDPDCSPIVRHGEAVHTKGGNVRVNLLSSDHTAVLRHPDDRVVPAIEDIDVGAAAKRRVAGEVARRDFGCRRGDVDGAIKELRREIPRVRGKEQRAR